MRKLLFVYGTRPEAIKMAPLILEFKKHPEAFIVKVCLTGQHREMLDQVNQFFDIHADHDLGLMLPNQTLSGLASRCMAGVDAVLEKESPDVVFVQGDTTTVMAAAIAAYHRRIPVAHIEAGLRSGDKYSPFPEELNRKIAGTVAHWHFAPTETARLNLEREGITDRVWVVGNTVIDALLLGLARVEADDARYALRLPGLEAHHRVIAVTGHRRESFGEAFEQMCRAMRDIADSFEDVHIVYPVHLNPNVQAPVKSILSGHPRIHLVAPVEYPRMIWLLNRSYLVLTDSGGIQEEAPALGKPVLVMRDVTERMEGVQAGTARLVGADRSRIFTEASVLLSNHDEYSRMAKASNPYGDGETSKRIVETLRESLLS